MAVCRSLNAALNVQRMFPPFKISTSKVYAKLFIIVYGLNCTFRWLIEHALLFPLHLGSD